MMAAADNRRRDDYLQTIDFEETELRLGLPGGTAVGVGNEGADENVANGVRNVGKRGFSETESSTATNDIDLKLNLSTKMESGVEKADQTLAAANHRPQLPRANNNNNDPAKPPAPKAQVVGWPPVRSYRKNLMSTAAQKTTTTPASTSDEKKTTENNAAGGSGSTGAAFVKVSLDGAPYLRKVDLKLYRSYNQLAEALGKMFSTVDNCGSQGTTKDFMKEGKSIDLLNGSEYVPTYEDKDGDWMLVGDIPWGVFVDSCKRLRIMKGSEAIGLAPRAVEKCKS